MDIEFAVKKLERLCTDGKHALKQLGARQSEKLRQRLDDLRAAETLQVMRHLPGRCHELKGDKAGQLSLDLVHPHRLIFEPAANPVPTKDDGGLDWEAIRFIRILGIEDTHG